MAQGAARRKSGVLQAQRAVPRRVRLAELSQPVQRVSQREPPEPELRLAEALQARAWQPQEQEVLPLALEPQASPPPAGVPEQPEEQQEPPLEPAAF